MMNILYKGLVAKIQSTNITRTLILTVFIICMQSTQVFGQNNFNSGSTGADGAFNPIQSLTLQVPSSGIFNFTTVNVPSGVVINFTANATNTPVTILASGNVTISGIIVLDGSGPNQILGGKGGPGGFRGGNGGAFMDIPIGMPGDGPGGGNGGVGAADLSSAGGGGGGGHLRQGNTGLGTNGGVGGARYGTRTLLPLVGGSGGGGQSASNNSIGEGGGGGGGAILIASSGTITFTSSDAQILARGGGINFGGGGSGGAIRLVANTITGNPRLYANGGGGWAGAGGSPGYIRAEAYDLNGLNPLLDVPFISYGLPNPVTLPNLPILNILSIGGVAAPATPKGSFYQQPDIVVPTSMSNPVTVNLQASNLPVGTVLQVTLTKESGERTTVNSTALAGTQASSTATASVLLPTSGVAVISASVTLNLLIAYDKPIHIDGERIDKMEIAAAFGGRSDVTYISTTGKRLKLPQ